LPLVLQLVTGFLRDKRFNSIGSFTRALSDLSAESWTAADAPYLYGRLLDWFWQLLTPEEQQVVAVVSLFDFASGAPEQDVVAITRAALNVRADITIRKLKRLADLGVLQCREQAETTRYHLHPIVYDYAQTRRERERTPPMTAIHAAYSRHMVDYVMTYSDDYTRLDAQKDNVIRMFATALADFSTPDFQGEMVTLLNRVYDYFDRRGLYTVAEQLLQAAQKVERVSDFDRVKLVFNLGQAAFKQGRMDDAEQLFNEAWERATECNFEELYGGILRDLGRVAIQRGEFDVATDYLIRGETYTIQQEQIVVWGQITANRAVISNLKGQYVSSYEYLEKAAQELTGQLIAGQSYDLRDTLQFVQNAIGVLALTNDAFDDAELYLRQSLVSARELNNSERLARSYINLGALSYNRSDFAAAEAYYTQALIVAEFVQHGESLTRLALSKGMLKIAQHYYGDAHRLLVVAVDLATDLNLKRFLPETYIWLGILHFSEGKLLFSDRYFSASLEQAAVYPGLIALALYGLALIVCYQEQLFIAKNWEHIEPKIKHRLEQTTIDRNLLKLISWRDLEKAQHDFQRALDGFPKLSRFQVVKNIWSWMIENVSQAGL